MSRICVKQIPKLVDEKKLREHFARFGEITDCKVMRTKDGASRLFGFVGFASKEAATKSLFYNGSYLYTSKISVELAIEKQSQDKPRPWSKYSQGSSSNKELMELKKAEEEKKQASAASSTTKSKDLKRKSDDFIGNGGDKSSNGNSTGEENDEKFKEFQSLMKRRGTRNLWSNNEGSTVQEGDGMEEESTSKEQLKKRKMDVKEKLHFDDDDEEEDDDDDEDAYQDLPALSKKNNNTKNGKDQDIMEEDSEESRKITNDSAVSDLDWLRSKVTTKDTTIDEEDEDEDDEEDQDGEEEDDDEQEEQEEEEEEENKKVDVKEVKVEKGKSNGDDLGKSYSNVGETGRLFVRNLSYAVDEQAIKEYFEPFGKLSEIYIPTDIRTKKSKGYAFVLFMVPENAVRAMSELDGKTFQGRIIQIIPADEAPHKEFSANSKGQEEASSSYKLKKERELKAISGQSHNWNSLFMRSDAIISSLADRYKLTNGQVIDPNTTDLAVRMTLMETHIINETKKFLEQEGVVIEKIGGKGIERSSTTLLVKNIPFKTTLGELESMFGKYGDLARTILTPARTIALIEYYNVNEAKTGFKSLAYTKFHTVPLFLEWAPTGIFKEAALTKEQKQEREKEEREKERMEPIESVTVKKEETTPTTTTTTPTPILPTKSSKQSYYVFIKNLSFDTREEQLNDRFKKLREFVSVTIATRMDPVRGKLSCGYGFAQFTSKAAAHECIKKWSGAVVDGHELSLKMSDKGQQVDAGAEVLTRGTISNKTTTTSEEGSNNNSNENKKRDEGRDVQVSTKLSIKNIPFEATVSELRKLFSTYGELASCRIPKKPTGGHRGFGFVEYITEQEATNAMEALKSSHIYGRHLVITYAEQDKNIDQLRDKASEQLNRIYKPSRY